MSIPAALGVKRGMLSGLPTGAGRFDLCLRDMVRSPRLEVADDVGPGRAKSSTLLNGIVGASTAEEPTSSLVRARNLEPCLHPSFDRSSSDGSVFDCRRPRPFWIIDDFHRSETVPSWYDPLRGRTGFTPVEAGQ